jgi:3-oxoadipate enol-lactonase
VSEARNGDVRLVYETRGSGPPLLLVHGLGYDRRGWGPLPGLLEDALTVVRFDNRGVGESDVPPGPYDVASMAADTAAVLDAAGCERAHVLGVSLGGLVAQELALAFPERIDRLVLVSTLPGGPRSHLMPQRGIDAFARFPTLPPAEGLRLLVETSLGDRGVRERPELVEEIYAYRLASPPPLAGWQAQAVAGASFDAYDRVAGIAAPTLVLQGTGDNVVDPRNAELLGELIPGARVELIPDAGHLMFWEEAERVAALVRGFLC